MRALRLPYAGQGYTSWISKLIQLSLCLWLCSPFQAALAEQIELPVLSQRVTDLTQTLTYEQVQALTQKLGHLEKTKGSQVAILLIPTTGEETIEQFGIRLADEWKLGREKVDDGLIIIIAKKDKRLRLEVGRGLEGAIPDVIAGRIIRETISPAFKKNDFYGGINAGLDQVISVINGESLPPPKPRGQSAYFNTEQVFGLSPFFWLGLIAVALVVNMFTNPWISHGGAGVAGFVAALVGGTPFFLAILVGLGATLILTMLVSRLFWDVAQLLLHIGFRGGSGGDGPFSGGGGGFGGGGASGDW